eukprot:Nitzschia sp. Nitz4//scaffold126_size65214//25353//25695//NITZ4_006151-RA/size65214-exonerate_est2genome-gene-0.30-mRNA-1//1//CDS//3329534674//7988//frame0
MRFGWSNFVLFYFLLECEFVLSIPTVALCSCCFAAAAL